jgi:hypothetical protein
MTKDREYDVQGTDELIAILFTSIETAKKNKKR